ncbi:hypothetical protein [Crocinitomix catalasitica]|uniref:hypothetical protein n=1 Tax=Crocinitomix catalasitica TaxID=184607 RepID=UPI000481E40E|nr:hypothetical protein [Crocinitomix catalasitica]
MKNLFLISLLFFNFLNAHAQVFNSGTDEIAFKKFLTNGITYVKTGDVNFDSVMIACLEENWTITDFKVVEQYKRPEKTSNALFVTTKEKTNKHMMDRNNQHILVLKTADDYKPRMEVNMLETLGYMYFNGFYPLVDEPNEYKFIYLLIKSLNKGLTLIRDNQFSGEDEEINEKITEAISAAGVPSVGNILIINREQTRHAISEDLLKEFNITYRLLSEDEYYATIAKKDPTHVLLYFAKNTFTEVALVKVATGEMFYAEHFRKDYASIDKKVLKNKISLYFQ